MQRAELILEQILSYGDIRLSRNGKWSKTDYKFLQFELKSQFFFIFELGLHKMLDRPLQLKFKHEIRIKTGSFAV